MESLKIGIVGLGGIATRMHIPALAKIPGVTIVAGAEINQQQAERTQRRFNIPQLYSSYEEMYEQEPLDAVYICLPNFLHFAAVQKALKQGLHVFCEKPMGLSATEAAEMARLAEEQNRLLMPGYNMRYVTNYARARELIRSKRLGKILQIQMTLARPGPYAGWDPKSDWYFKQGNLGVLYDQGGHGIDLIRFVCGVEITDLCARSTRTLPGMEVPDSIVAAFQTEGAAVGTLNLTWGASANVDMLVAHGTAGSVIVSWNYFEHLKPGGAGVDRMMTLLDNIFVIMRRVGRSVLRMPVLTDPYQLIAEDFINCIRNESLPRVTAWDGVHALEVLATLSESLPDIVGEVI